jgi:hypothetical protein
MGRAYLYRRYGATGTYGTGRDASGVLCSVVMTKDLMGLFTSQEILVCVLLTDDWKDCVCIYCHVRDVAYSPVAAVAKSSTKTFHKGCVMMSLVMRAGPYNRSYATTRTTRIWHNWSGGVLYMSELSCRCLRLMSFCSTCASLGIVIVFFHEEQIGNLMSS